MPYAKVDHFFILSVVGTGFRITVSSAINACDIINSFLIKY